MENKKEQNKVSNEEHADVQCIRSGLFNKI